MGEIWSRAEVYRCSIHHPLDLLHSRVYRERIQSTPGAEEYTGQVKLKAEQGASSVSRFLRHGSLSQGPEAVPVSTPIDSGVPSVHRARMLG